MSCLICLLKEILEVLECTVAQAVEKMNPDERDELKVSGKKAIKKSGCTKRFHVLFTTGCSYIYFFPPVLLLQSHMASVNTVIFESVG